MSYEVDRELFAELARREPREICAAAPADYDGRQRSYTLSLWHDDYRVSLEGSIEPLSRNLPQPHDYFPIFVINYLLQAQERPLSRVWISEKDLVGGAGFFRGPHEIPTRNIVAGCGGSLEEFGRRCERLGGSRLDLADASYGFSISPRIAVAALFWLGDEDFEPEAKLLWDSSIAGMLALDTVFALAVDVCSRLARQQQETI